MLYILFRTDGVRTAQYIPTKPGPFIDDTTGEVIGEHQGLHTFTVGQNARIRGLKEKMFVSRKDPRTNEIFVVPGRFVFSISIVTRSQDLQIHA